MDWGIGGMLSIEKFGEKSVFFTLHYFGSAGILLGKMRAMLLEDLTYRIIGCAMEVHKIPGNGFQEVVYQRCLAYELATEHVVFGRETEQPLLYKGKDVGTRRADFIVENKIVIELKAVINLENVHLSQAKNYLVAYDFPLGLLINFGSASLQYKRALRLRRIWRCVCF